jgi:hypothetical protein
VAVTLNVVLLVLTDCGDVPEMLLLAGVSEYSRPPATVATFAVQSAELSYSLHDTLPERLPPDEAEIVTRSWG